jgi:hypothetical protein
MFDREMRLLDVLCVGTRDRDGDVGQGGKLTVGSGQDHGAESVDPGTANGTDHIRRIPTGADPDQDVAGSPESFDLPLENAVESTIVGIGSQERAVGRQRNRRERRSLERLCQPTHELSSHVLTIGRAAPVPADQNFARGAKGLRDQIGRREDGIIACLSRA